MMKQYYGPSGSYEKKGEREGTDFKVPPREKDGGLAKCIAKVFFLPFLGETG